VIKLNEWVCTDPDNKQYGRWLGGSKYQFKELDFEGEWLEIDIDISQYPDEELEDVVGSYYNSLGELREIYGEDSDWIIAETIFEQESGIYLT
jgi:hypothetical protein